MLKNLKQSISVWLIKKVQRYGPHKVRVLDSTYKVSADVFNPRFYYTSEFMARHIMVTPEDCVLDMGTGSGIQAVTAGRMAGKVIAIDINPEAVRLASENARNNGVADIVEVIKGDLFSPLDDDHRFSVILFTPPYLHGTVKTHLDHALFDADKALLARFFREAGKHLSPGGYVQMIYSSIADPGQALDICRELGWRHSIIASEQTFMEKFIIFKLSLT